MDRGDEMGLWYQERARSSGEKGVKERGINPACRNPVTERDAVGRKGGGAHPKVTDHRLDRQRKDSHSRIGFMDTGQNHGSVDLTSPGKRLEKIATLSGGNLETGRRGGGPNWGEEGWAMSREGRSGSN